MTWLDDADADAAACVADGDSDAPADEPPDGAPDGASDGAGWEKITWGWDGDWVDVLFVPTPHANSAGVSSKANAHNPAIADFVWSLR